MKFSRFCHSAAVALVLWGLILSGILWTSPSALAQTGSASVSGRVADQQGAVITGAEVEIRNVDTNVAQVTTTNGEGFYSLPALKPGRYLMSVRKELFRTVSVTGVVLTVQENLSRNFTLQVGSSAESITVTAEAQAVNTTDASVSTVIDQTYVKNMPLNGRSFQDLILLTPGVVTNTPQHTGTSGMDGEFSVNGQRTDSNNYTVDGVSANVGATANANASFYATTDGSGASGSISGATALGTTQALVSVDELQEFRVQSSSYSAQYGRTPGGQFAFETKSGTNQWHGTIYDYLRNDVFDATDYFTNYFRAVDPTLKKTPVRQNDFGGTFSGPVRIPHLYNGKDKTFFFVSYEGMRLRLPQAAASSFVPDLCMRGDAASCPEGRAPAAEALLPVIKSFAIPTPGLPVDLVNGVGQFVGAWSNPASINSFSVRLDHNVSDKLRLFFRFNNTYSDSESRGLAVAFIPPTMVSTNSSTLRTYTAGANSLLSSRLSNEFRLNYTSNAADGSDTIEPFGGSSPLDLVQLTGLTGFSRPSPGVLFLLGSNYVQQAVILNAGAQQQWNLVDTVGLSVGRHRFSFGVDYRRLTPYSLPSSPLVSYGYYDEPSVEANLSYEFIQQFADAHPLYKNFSLFAQDEWRAADRLTLSMGLRWEVNPPPGVTEGLMPYTIQFGPDPNNWALAPKGTPLWKTTWFNFAPRFGIAYAIRNREGWETVLRTGGGVFFDVGNQTGSQGFQGPGFTSPGVFPAGSFPGDPASQIPPVDTNPSLPVFQLYGYHPHLQLPYTIQWNVSLEQALGKSQAITASYVASKASRLLQTNGFDSTIAYQPVQVTGNGGSSDYNALQLQFRRRLSHGLTALASHTWSHCLDYGSSNFLNGYERENCDFDVRHNFSGAFSFDVPNVGHNGIANALLHHWGIDDRFSVHTGFPVDLRGSQVYNPATGQRLSNGLNFTGAPVYIYGADCAAVYANNFGSTLPCPGGRAINPDAFTLAPGAGNVPRNFARGFGAWQMDMAVRREFPIHERLRLQFRAEAFNIFNHPNFGTIDGQFGRSTFGQATATLANSIGVLNPLYQMGGSRSMQFALKLVF